jgi:hypothetical protein
LSAQTLAILPWAGGRGSICKHRNRVRHVAAELAKAVAGGDTADVSIALRMVLSMEGVEYEPK